MKGQPLWRPLVVVLALAVGAAVVMASSPVAQDLAYHRMADQRTRLGVPNCMNVLSNLPFAVVAALGLAALFRTSGNPPPGQWERWPYTLLFIGTGLTPVGVRRGSCHPTAVGGPRCRKREGEARVAGHPLG